MNLPIEMQVTIHQIAVWVWSALAVVTFISLCFVSAPYGRHRREGWGPTVDQRLGWVVMELPALLTMVALFLLGDRQGNLVAWCWIALWVVHYFNRSVVYPIRLPARGKRTPLSIVGMAMLFNLISCTLQGLWLFRLSPHPELSWFVDGRFLVGLALFVFGFALNFHSDEVLRRLRATGDGGYVVPKHGLFRYVSSPNYLGEIIEWCGWAMLTWSMATASFALWTIANLAPRAIAHHRWYREQFPNYPRTRRALVPGLL